MTLIQGTDQSLVHQGDVPGPAGFAWGFVALEYYAWILNRVCLVAVTKELLVIATSGGPLASSRYVSVLNYDPLYYVSKRRMRKYAGIPVDSDDLLCLGRGNRRFLLSDITEVRADQAGKWGMGQVPYSGRIVLTANAREIELILLGNQDCDRIIRRLRRAITGA